MPRTYGDEVIAESNVPAYVLDHPDCPPAVRAAYDAFLAATEAVATERDKVDAIKDELEDNRAAIRRAIAEGKRPPAPISEEIIKERVRQGELLVRHARNRAYAAARAYEASIPANHAGIRAIIAARLPERAAEARRKLAELRALADEVRGAQSLLMSLDLTAALKTYGASSDQYNAVRDHYEALVRRDAFYRPGVPSHLDMAWEHVEAYAAGVPADQLVAKPLDKEA